MKPIVIFGSSNKTGRSYSIMEKLGYDIFYINGSDMSFFDYTQANRNDDFGKLMHRIDRYYDRIILATPMYWYTMSGHMKMFLDRLTDLTINKNKVLAGKSMYLMATYGGSETEYFEGPFRLTANYMFMSFRGCMYIRDKDSDDLVNRKILAFKNRIERNSIYIDNYFEDYILKK
ncbi:MAG: NAD(P)H-dependent oxidoreductase [Pseudomonadota bacterium]